MNEIVIIILVLAVVAAVGFGIWGYRRWRYVDGLRKRGWQFETSPSLSEMIGLNHAPFGAGLRRSVDDLVVGRASNGVPFRAIEYDYDGWNSRHYVVIFPLPKSLPFLYARPAARASSIPGLPSGISTTHGSHAVLGASEDYVREMGATVTASMGELDGYEVSVDHANLVVFDVAEDVDELARVVEGGARLAAAVAAASGPWSAPAAPRHIAFNHRPHWTYIARDDSWLQRVPHTRGGHSHRALDIIHGEEHGIGFVRLEHRWKTEHRDKDGKTTTRNHREYLCQHHIRFPFQELDLGSNPLGIANDRTGLQFESADFNSAYKVSAADPKFASDVLHPRMMEWLLAVGSPRIRVRHNGAVQVPGNKWDLAELDRANDLLVQFFGRVPDFVWQNLGAWPRPVPEALEAPRTP